MLESKEKRPTMKGWTRATIGDLFEISSSKRVLQSAWKTQGIPFYRAREIARLAATGVVQNELFIDEEHFDRLRMRFGAPEPNDLMVSAVGTLGACYVVRAGDKFYFKDASVLQFRPKAVVDSRFFWHALRTQSLLDQINAGSGSTVGTLTISRAQGLAVDFPPLAEQRRIAAILDQADALRHKRRETLAGIGRLKLSLLSSFVRGSGCTRKTKLASICTKITDGTHQAPEWVESGVPFVFVSNVRNGELSLETNKFVSPATHAHLTRYAPIELGDVLYTAVGSYGHSAVVETDEPFLFQRHVAHLKPNRHEVRSAFLAPLLESPIVKRQADRVAKGIAQKTVTLADLKAFEIELPSLSQQDEFVRQAGEIDHLKDRQINHLADLDTLFASLQHRAFQGEL